VIFRSEMNGARPLILAGGGERQRGEGIECLSYFMGNANAFGVELQDSF
jgi:hypothetical protein